jgi:hypothetical protein
MESLEGTISRILGPGGLVANVGELKRVWSRHFLSQLTLFEVRIFFHVEMEGTKA